jgi:hypothetical protein
MSSRPLIHSPPMEKTESSLLLLAVMEVSTGPGMSSLTLMPSVFSHGNG